MKNPCLLLLLTLFLVPTPSPAAQPTRLATPGLVTAVTVYPDRALTTRRATFRLKSGSYLVAFENLPPLLQDDSVQVTGKGTGATIAGIEVKRAFLAQSGEKRAQELNQQIRELERRSGSLDARRAALASQKAFTESIRVAWGERISKELAIGRPTSAELADAIGFVGTQVARAEEQSRDIELEKRQVADRIDALRRQLDEETGSRRRETKNVEVLVDVAREGELTLELTALLPQAGWVPAYDVRLSPDGSSAQLLFRAMVRQQTGEDWHNVNLTLSTARPATGGAPPELSPWRISFPRPRPQAKSALRSAPAPAMAERGILVAESAPADGAAAEGESAAFETALAGEEHSSVAFSIPRPLDIPSDNSQHGTVVAVEKLPVSLEYVAVPKLSPYVFLKSEITNRAAYPLLPGRVSTFVGTTFTGSSQLKKVASGESFDLYFGTDDQVAVKREELAQRREGGLFGGNRVGYRFRIELANYRKQPVTVTLRDQLPLAGDEEIKVSLQEPSLKPEEIKDDGSLAWKLPLAAGEKKAITFGILVEYPKDREISGL